MPIYRIYYARTPTFHASGAYGTPFLTVAALGESHVYLHSIRAQSLDDALRQMQGEIWSPHGEARQLLESLGLGHTSMSIGDVVQDEEGTFWECLEEGWRPIGVRTHQVRLAAGDGEFPSLPVDLCDVVAQIRAKARLPAEVQRWLELVGPAGYVVHVRRAGDAYAVTFAEREPKPYQQLAWDIAQAVPEVGVQSLNSLLWDLERAREAGGTARVNAPGELIGLLYALVHREPERPGDGGEAQDLALAVDPLDNRALCPACGEALYCAIEVYASGVPLYGTGEEEHGPYHDGFDADPDDGSHTETGLASVYCSGCDWRLDLKGYQTTLTVE